MGVLWIGGIRSLCQEIIDKENPPAVLPAAGGFVSL